MELILFIGIQASGKSTYYRDHFAVTHLRLNLDMLRTRHREGILYKVCLESKTPVVIDNTNLTKAERARYISLASSHKFTVKGYFFDTNVVDSMARNALRLGKQRIPDIAIKASIRKLERPLLEEGFDQLWVVRISNNNQFIAKEWPDEVQ